MDSSQNIRSFNNDELFLIAIHLDLPTLINFCSTNRQYRKLCNTRVWKYRLEKDFSNYLDSFPNLNERNKYKLLYDLQIIKGAIGIKENLIEIYNLQQVNSSDNEIREIPKEISQLHNLQQLYLNNNKIEKIPKEIGQLVNLRTLFLSNNKIKEIPQEVRRLKNLRIYE